MLQKKITNTRHHGVCYFFALLIAFFMSAVENNKTLSLIEMYYYNSFGANLPVGPEKLADETTTFEVKDGYYKITYQNRNLKKYH